MTMVKLGDGITEINGKQAGNVWRRDNCGQHVQKTPRRVETKTNAQWNQRAAWIKCCNYWLNNATAEIEDMWWLWSYNHPITNKKGETRFLTPFNAYMKYNLPRVRNGSEIKLYPPID